MNWTRDDYLITDRREEMDIQVVHGFLTESYWAKGIARATVEKSMRHSLCLGVFHQGRQVGFGRAVTDCSTFAYLADVFILPDHRGLGLGKWLVSCFLQHEELQGLRRWLLATADAHGLYRQNGFAPLRAPERFMEKLLGS